MTERRSKKTTQPRRELVGRLSTSLWHELREREHKAVVRIFLFQSKSAEMIPEQADLANLTFVDTVLIRKGPGPSENQLMPIGGKVDDGETIDQAVKREALEETHLRPIPKTLTRFSNVQNYRFRHQNEQHQAPTTKQRRAYFFAGNLLPAPHDVPYVLDQKEDKIINFERLNPDQLAHLLHTGSIVTEQGSAEILDSLNLDATARLEHGTQADDIDIRNVHEELLQNFALREAQKKLDVLIMLLSIGQQVGLGTPGEEIHRLRARTDECLDRALDSQIDTHKVIKAITTRTETMWREIIANHPEITVNRVRQALTAANVRETLQNAAENYNYETGVGIPTINLIFPLLFNGEFTLSKYRILQANQQADQLMTLTQILHHVRVIHDPDTAAKKRTYAEQACRKRLGLPSGAPIDLPTIQQWMQETGILSRERSFEYESLAEGIDRYFEVLNREAHTTEFNIDQVNEVKGVPFEQLVELSFSADAGASQREPEYNRRVAWEAQRKLLLLLIVHEANAYRAETMRRGIQPIDALEQSLEASGSKAGQRVLLLKGKLYRVKIERRIKSIMSFVRKLIVRDQMSMSVADDTYGESIIFDGPEADYTTRTFEPSGPMTDANNAPLTTCTAPAAVADYIETLFAQAATRKDTIRIVRYKGLPAPGEAFHSSGAGGGAEVRMVKFCIEHTEVAAPDKKPIHRLREVQLFLPNIVKGHWQSGLVDYEHKKTDDADYALRRLFSAKALRSFMELLYPAEIYGDSIQPIYSSRVDSTVS